MRILHILIYFCFGILQLNTAYSQKNENDTIILKIGELDSLRNKVYLLPKAGKEKYKPLREFKYNRAYFNLCKEEELEAMSGKRSKSNKTKYLPKHWIPLYFYNGNYYVYQPCDGIFKYSVIIKKRFICETDESGLYPREFNSLKRIDDLTFTNNETNYRWNEKNLQIKIIDKINGIAVFSSRIINDNKTHYRLMVDARKIEKFQLIINECIGSKEGEFDFEQPDFKVLLKETD